MNDDGRMDMTLTIICIFVLMGVII